MDARLRKRRGVLRVSTSQHIDCSVRRRPFGSTLFYAALANSFLAASALQMRPLSSWMRCTPQPYLQQPYSLWDRQHSPTTLAMRRAVRSVLARRVPSSPYPSTSGGKSLILKRVAENRAPYSRFRFQDVSKRVCQEVCVSPISLTGTSRFSAGPPRRTGAGCAPGTSRRDGSPRPTCDTAPAPSGTAASSPPPRWGTTPASRPCGNWR